MDVPQRYDRVLLVFCPPRVIEKIRKQIVMIVFENLQDIAEEIDKPTPHARKVLLRLEDTGRVIEEISRTFGNNLKTYRELIKSLEIVEQLILLSEKAFSGNE